MILTTNANGGPFGTAIIPTHYRMERTGLEPVTPCLQSIYQEAECLQAAHSWGRDAYIFVHPAPNICILRTFVSVIVSVILR